MSITSKIVLTRNPQLADEEVEAQIGNHFQSPLEKNWISM